MPQENMSSRIGKSSSPVINRVIQSNKNVQQPLGAPAQAVAAAYNKKPVSPNPGKK